MRKSLFGNIVLSGGSTLTKGFGSRLLHEVQRLAVKDMRIKILAPPERIYTTWTGGSILAGLSTFKKVSRSLGTEDLTGALTKQRCGSRRMNGKKTQTSSIQSLPRRSVARHVAIRPECRSPQTASATSFLDGCITLGTGVSHGIGIPVPGKLSYEIRLPTAS